MAVIKKVGAPTRMTEGSVGDTYIDLKTKKSYICTSAYKASTGSVDYAWRENEGAVIDVTEDEYEVKETPVKAPTKVPTEKKVKERVKKEPVKEVVEEAAEEPAKPQKYNYNKQFNN